jgi:hypothetical protein
MLRLKGGEGIDSLVVVVVILRRERYMSDKNGGFGTFFSGFVLGGIAGAVAVFLTAPRSGLETREQIRARSSQLQGTAQRTVDDVLTTVKAAALDVSNRTEELRVQN